jgi:hypothetical protein
LSRKAALQPRVLVQSHDPPGVGDGVETGLIGAQQALQGGRGLSGVRVDRGQRRHLVVQRLQVLVGFFGQGFLVLDEEAFLGVTYGRQFDLDLQRQRFSHFKNLELAVVAEHSSQRLMVVPGDADKKQADDDEAEADFFTDA